LPAIEAALNFDANVAIKEEGARADHYGALFPIVPDELDASALFHRHAPFNTLLGSQAGPPEREEAARRADVA
jgi:hypothetical protein